MITENKESMRKLASKQQKIIKQIIEKFFIGQFMKTNSKKNRRELKKRIYFFNLIVIFLPSLLYS